MKQLTCDMCGGNDVIKQDGIFVCQDCGTKYSVEEARKMMADSAITVQKENSPLKEKMNFKKIIIIAAAAILAIAMIAIVICEVKISKAWSYYQQDEYFEAYRQVKNIPSLGREKVIRIKTAYFAGDQYEFYLSTKRNRLSPTSSGSNDAYRDGFFELTFGLYLDLEHLQNRSINDIERAEYERFVEIYYDELYSMFYISRSEANELVEEYRRVDEVSAMKDVGNRWLEDNFFD